MNRNKNIVFGMLALVVSVVAIGLAYAGFTGTLNVNGTGNVVSSKWDIYFANLANAVTTGTANVVTPATISPKTKIGDYYVELASPGDSVTYTFDVVNDGNFDAILTTLTKSAPTCVPNVTLCNYLTYTLKYTEDDIDVAEDDELLAGETKNMTLVLTLRSDTPASALSNTELSVTGLGITLLYSQNSSYKNGSGSSGGSSEIATDTSCFTYQTIPHATVVNQSACENYLQNQLGYSSEESTIMCTGGGNNLGTLDYYLEQDIPSTDYETAGLSVEDAIKITGYDDECTKDVVIPSVIENKSVISIGYDSFKEKQLTSVTIPNSVISIGSYAFASNELTEIDIPSSVSFIDTFAFFHNKFTSLEIPYGVTYINYGSFQNNQITDITIPSSVVDINGGDGDEPFLYNPVETVYVDMPNVPSYTFGYLGMTTLTLGPHVQTIGYDAFAHNNLTSVTIPNGVTTISEWAFESNQLTTVTIGNHVETIGEGAFRDNQLTSVTIPNNVQTIGSHAFSSNQLTSVTINNKTSSNDFSTYYGSDIWGWADGYNDSNIIWTGSN